jgi:hypothetical protein
VSSIPETLRMGRAHTARGGAFDVEARSALNALDAGTVVVVDTRDNCGPEAATRDDVARALMSDWFEVHADMLAEHFGEDDGCGVGPEPCGGCYDCQMMALTAGMQAPGEWEKWQTRANMLLLHLSNTVRFRRRESEKDGSDV